MIKKRNNILKIQDINEGNHVRSTEVKVHFHEFILDSGGASKMEFLDISRHRSRLFRPLRPARCFRNDYSSYDSCMTHTV